MPFTTRKAALAAAAAFGLLALAACGGGGGGAAPQTSRVTLPEGHTVASGSFSVPAGRSVERGGVRFSCAAGGAACAVVVNPGSGQARVTGGRLTVARVQAATPAPQPASVTLPQGHSVASGSFSVPAGRSVERGGVRFSCAAGGAACAVTVNPGSGQARVTGGRLTVALVQAAAPPPGDGGQGGGMEEPDWPFPDWPIADVTSGGGTLSWTPSEIYNRIRAFEGRRVFDTFASVDINSAVWCTAAYSVSASCNVEFSPVMTHLHGGVPIVRARALWSGNIGVGGRPSEEIGVGGILDHGYFMVARAREYIGRDYEDEEIKAELRETWSFDPSSSTLDDPTTGRWRGALIGTGRNAASPLYRQFIIGDVDVTVRPRDTGASVSVAFDNIRNHSTGDRNVMLSHMRWDFVAYTKRPYELNQTRPGYIRMHFLGPNDEEVLGVFHTEEAVGGFGAKKQ